MRINSKSKRHSYDEFTTNGGKRMEITYIGHSGFLMEWERCYWLFDYYKGMIPELDRSKKLFVFVSHKHGDHYNTEIFKLVDKCPDIEYILSSDIGATELRKAEEDQPGTNDRTLMVKPVSEYTLFDQYQVPITIRTLKSTDCGVAFLINYKGRMIYHAGDLNQWVWKGESKQYNNDMTARYNTELNRLKELKIDVAFVPLDPRLEDWYYKGLESLLNTTRIRYVFPMHFWDKPMIIRRFKQEHTESIKDTQIFEINQEGQKWKIDNEDRD